MLMPHGAKQLWPLVDLSAATLVQSVEARAALQVMLIADPHSAYAKAMLELAKLWPGLKVTVISPARGCGADSDGEPVMAQPAPVSASATSAAASPPASSSSDTAIDDAASGTCGAKGSDPALCTVAAAAPQAVPSSDRTTVETSAPAAAQLAISSCPNVTTVLKQIQQSSEHGSHRDDIGMPLLLLHPWSSLRRCLEAADSWSAALQCQAGVLDLELFWSLMAASPQQISAAATSRASRRRTASTASNGALAVVTSACMLDYIDDDQHTTAGHSSEPAPRVCTNWRSLTPPPRSQVNESETIRTPAAPGTSASTSTGSDPLSAIKWWARTQVNTMSHVVSAAVLQLMLSQNVPPAAARDGGDQRSARRRV